MAPYDMGEAPVRGWGPACGLEERVDRVGTGWGGGDGMVKESRLCD